LFNKIERGILMNMKDPNTLNKALGGLARNTGIVAWHIEHNLPFADYDADLKLEGQKFAVEVKGIVTKSNIGAVINQIKNVEKEKSVLLIADHINPNIADILRNEQVNYLDTVGNAYIKAKGIFVLIKGNKATVNATINGGRAFNPTGLKITYALLVKPTLLNATYRDIAEAANVALGAVGWVLGDLKKQNYIIEGLTNKRRKWNPETKGQLIEKWVERYPVLKAKHTLGQYFTTNPDWWQEAKLGKYHGLFGAEIAAQKLTLYLRPQDHLIYLDKKELNNFLLDFRLATAKKGNQQGTKIEVIDKFWGQVLNEGKKITHPLLTYADLISTADARNREAAMMIKEGYFDW
jgi:hypothetical protein